MVRCFSSCPGDPDRLDSLTACKPPTVPMLSSFGQPGKVLYATSLNGQVYRRVGKRGKRRR